jgi:hypothetical protein
MKNDLNVALHTKYEHVDVFICKRTSYYHKVLEWMSGCVRRQYCGDIEMVWVQIVLETEKNGPLDDADIDGRMFVIMKICRIY